MQTREVQGQLWSKAPAHWVKYIEPTFIPIYRKVLDEVVLHEEAALLDAGCGAGLFLSMASASGALLDGIDAAPGMLSVARQRVRGASLRIEDLEMLPYIDGTFDVVTGLNSFQYAHSFQNALAEARRVVKRHGKVVIATWDSKENCDARVVFNEVAKLLPVPFGNQVLDEDDKIESICKLIGLKKISSQTVFCPWSFNSDAELQEGFLSCAPCSFAVEQIGEEAVRTAIMESAQLYNPADEVYYFHNYFKLFVTEKI